MKRSKILLMCVVAALASFMLVENAHARETTTNARPAAEDNGNTPNAANARGGVRAVSSRCGIRLGLQFHLCAAGRGERFARVRLVGLYQREPVAGAGRRFHGGYGSRSEEFTGVDFHTSLDRYVYLFGPKITCRTHGNLTFLPKPWRVE